MLAINAPALIAPAAFAQNASPTANAPETAETRIRRMEAEIKALQRQVFPGGGGRYFEPEIAGSSNAATTAANGGSNASGTNAISPSSFSEVLTRLDAMESQIARLTAQVEEGGNRMNRLEARIAALEPPPVVDASQPASTQPASETVIVPETTPVSSPTPVAVAAPTPTPTPAPTAARTAPTADRLAAVQAIIKPQSADAGEDEYNYGFRLWEAKFYPEAQQQLQATVNRFPNHARISYARNLLGRAFLDDEKPGTAAPIFLDNYRRNPQGERAPDSLLYLGVSMTRRNDLTRACASFAELARVYPDAAIGRLVTQLTRAKAEAKCN